jgi:hypothetical protein
MPVILAAWEAEIGSIAFRGQPRQMVYETPISKITRENLLEVAQEVECLPYKHEALSSSPIPTKKKKKKERKKEKEKARLPCST